MQEGARSLAGKPDLWRIRVSQLQPALEENGLQGKALTWLQGAGKGAPFPAQVPGMQDRELCGATPALVRQDGSAASPEQCSPPKLCVLLPFPEQLSFQKPPRNLIVPHSGRRATGTSPQSRLREGSRRDWHQVKSQADSQEVPWDAIQTSRTDTRLQRHCLRDHFAVRWGLAECKAALTF